jgi:DNA-binding FadR family transcriptional regulator
MDLIDRLRAALESDRFPDGARLPPERSLAIEFGTSRATLRKSLALLEAEGHIWRHVGRGTFVGRRPPIETPALTALVNQTHPEEVMEVRFSLEPQIAALAARRASAADIAAMERCITKGAAAGDVSTFELWDGAFHRAMANGAHNALLFTLFEAVNAIRQEAIWGRLKEASLTRSRQQHYLQQHRACIAAIRDRDPAAAEAAMRDHLETVRRNMFEPAVGAAE